MEMEDISVIAYMEAKKARKGAGTKDIVFMMGSELSSIPQPTTEITVPYKGIIEKVEVTVGIDSDPHSNLQFSIEKYNGTNWIYTDIYSVGVSERFKEFEVDIPIEFDRVRINLNAGDYERVSSMSIIARVRLI